jgi:sigma-54 dependent transcriptional regulator, acetoin dehydrogenase operon transcriptional activator AcoR
MNHLPSSSLVQSRAARIELARLRYFEEGVAPTGMVSETVFESWSRCLRLHGNPHERAVFEPVSASRAQLALTKNRQLHQAWSSEVPRLESVLGTTSCAAMLTDATGVLIGSTCVGRSHESLMPVATRLGVNLAEDAVGTTAPGVVARTGKPVSVFGGEHFFDSVKAMHCAAAPIRDIRGRVAGVLDISSEALPFTFDAAAVAGLYASAVENRLLVAQSTEHLVIRFQVDPQLLDSTLVGLIGIDADGRLAWENGVARSLLEGPRNGGSHSEQTLEERLGMTWSQWAALPAAGAAPLALPNGLHVWARAEMRGRDGHRGFVASAANRRVAFQASDDALRGEPSPEQAGADNTVITEPTAANEARAATPTLALPRLRDSGLDLIQKTLLTCNGNVSDAARLLGVSRGLIYRRLRDSRPRAAPSADGWPFGVPKRNTPSPE